MAAGKGEGKVWLAGKSEGREDHRDKALQGNSVMDLRRFKFRESAEDQIWTKDIVTIPESH